MAVQAITNFSGHPFLFINENQYSDLIADILSILPIKIIQSSIEQKFMGSELAEVVSNLILIYANAKFPVLIIANANANASKEC